MLLTLSKQRLAAIRKRLEAPDKSQPFRMRQVSLNDEDLKARFGALTTRESVADLLEVPRSKLTYHLFKVSESKKYMEFVLPKKSGGLRPILAPAGALKLIQRKLAFVLNRVYTPKSSVNGFVIARSIKTNAERHLRMRYVLNLDLKDFFPSINFGRVRGMFMANPYSVPNAAATVLAQICCFRNQLPQGAPTSPIVSNMICSKLDSQLQALAKEHRCVYTRYADDITFSTSLKNFPKAVAHLVNTKSGEEVELGPLLRSIIEGNGFVINPEKLRLRTANQRQEVTGLTVNRIVNVKRGFIREIRAMLHAWEKFGLGAAEEAHRDAFEKKQRSPTRPTPAFAKIVAGKLSFLSSIRGTDDPTFLRLLRQANRLDPSFAVPPQSAAIRTSDDLLKTIWVLECEEDVRQGTAFMLAGVGLVTCDHVLGCATRAFQPCDPTTRYPVRIVARNEGLDLAILEIEPMPQVGLEIGDPDMVKHLDQITLLGFPNFNLGDTGLVKRGEVVGFRVVSTFRRIIISASVVGGNSGGPLLDSRNRVIGIAVTGSDDSRTEHLTENHAAIPVTALSHLIAN